MEAYRSKDPDALSSLTTHFNEMEWIEINPGEVDQKVEEIEAELREIAQNCKDDEPFVGQVSIHYPFSNTYKPFIFSKYFVDKTNA